MRILRFALLTASLLAGWLVSHLAANAQSVSTPASTLQSWHNNSQGMSSNAKLAFYRLRNNTNSSPLTPSGRTLYAAPYYAITTRRSVATVAPTYSTNRAPAVAKPFAEVQYAPNAVQRYWPLLLEGREDLNTGLVIWRLP